MHPNEIALVFLGTSGKALPTREFLALDADSPSVAHRVALREQAQRQRVALEAQVESEVTVEAVAA